MNAATEIRKLDGRIARFGQSIAFRRGSTEHSATGFVRGYKVEQLVGLITQADREVIMSPSSLGSYGMPRANDDFATAGSLGKVEAVQPFHIDNTLVRIELRVRMT